MNLRKRRLELGLRQEDIAKRIGKSRALVGKIETGVSLPSVSTAIKLAEALGLSDWRVFFKELCE